MKPSIVAGMVMVLGWLALIVLMDDGDWRSRHVDAVVAFHNATCRTDDGTATMHWNLNATNAPLRTGRGGLPVTGPIVRIEQAQDGDAPAAWGETLSAWHRGGRGTHGYPRPGRVTYTPAGDGMRTTDFDTKAYNSAEAALRDGPPKRYWITQQRAGLGDDTADGVRVTGSTLALVEWAPGQMRLYHRNFAYRPTGRSTFSTQAGRPTPRMGPEWTEWNCVSAGNVRARSE